MTITIYKGGLSIKNFNLLALSTVFLVVIIGVVIFSSESTPSISNAKVTDHPSIDNQPTVGTKEASISIVEFGDFLCPSCQAWNENIFPKLENDYIKTGLAKFSYVNVLIHGDASILSSLVAETILKRDSNSYWKFHGELFHVLHDKGEIDEEGIKRIVEENTNVSITDLDSNIKNLTFKKELNRDIKLIEENGITSTPTIIINGTIVEDPFDYKEIEKIILESKKQ